MVSLIPRSTKVKTKQEGDNQPKLGSPGLEMWALVHFRWVEGHKMQLQFQETRGGLGWALEEVTRSGRESAGRSW